MATTKHSLKRPAAKTSKNERSARKEVLEDLNPVDSLVPYNRSFLKLGAGDAMEGKKAASIFGNVKHLFGSFKVKEMERPQVMHLRAKVGDLKNSKAVEAKQAIENIEVPGVSNTSEPKTKKELLDEKRKNISKQAKEGKKDKEQIGVRIEIEKLKKRFPGDPNLTILDAILTSRDGCLPYRSINDRVVSLQSALKQAGHLVAKNFLTTYSIDILFDIYFLYLDTLKKYYLDRGRKVLAEGGTKRGKNYRSIQRDIRLVNVLLGQSKLKKTISNVAQKLNGFGYPFISMTNKHVAKTFEAEATADNEKVGPGTVKLNRFLVRIYLNVLSQIPIFQPIASQLCEALPNDYQSKIMIANVNLDNAYTQLRISKAINAPTISRQALAIFIYGKQIAKSTIKNNANSPAEARILLRTAEMAEEYAYINEKVEPDIIKYGHQCATQALSFFQPEAETIIRRLFEVADKRKVNLSQETPEHS